MYSNTIFSISVRDNVLNNINLVPRWCILFQFTGRTFSRCRAILIYMIYRKAIKMSLSSSINDKKSSIGKKITMMGSDTRIIAHAVSGLHFMFTNMMLVNLVCVLLYYQIGAASFVGWVFFVIFCGPIQRFIGKQVQKASRVYIQSSDHRVKFIGELITGIQVTKMYCWESVLLDKVFEYRRKEMRQLLKRIRYSALLNMMEISSPHLMILIMLGMYVALGNPLTLSKTFTVITLVQLLKIAIWAIPWGVMLMIGAQVSLYRLDRFFANKEQNDMVLRMQGLNQQNSESTEDSQQDPKPGAVTPMTPMTPITPITPSMNTNTIVSMKNATFIWEENDEIQIILEDKRSSNKPRLDKNRVSQMSQFKLNELTLNLEKGKLYGLVGLVGSGKSSLIQAILGEMIMTEGYCQVNVKHDKCVGYVSQKPFIINDTVRENILMGLDFDDEYYFDCIDAAALTDDLDILIDGDMTEIGERGINLSGGQKARVSFARALYRKNMTNLYLLDDPLSAVCI